MLEIWQRWTKQSQQKGLQGHLDMVLKVLLRSTSASEVLLLEVTVPSEGMSCTRNKQISSSSDAAV